MRAPHLALILSFVVTPCLAQEAIPFAGGELTVTENDDFEKILAFDGRALAKEYFVGFDRIADVGGTEVAFFSVGSGGNACAPATLMIWRPEGGEITAERTQGDCGGPPAAIAWDKVYFVPYLKPGEAGAAVNSWAPGAGFALAGTMSFAPEPDTGWSDLATAEPVHPYDLFRNAELYAAARALLGDRLAEVVASLGTASGPERSASGLIVANGCVPHACGVADGFVAADPAARKVWIARQADDAIEAWPALDGWPHEARKAMEGALGR